MAMGTGISKEDLLDSIMLFAVLHEKPTFTARECSLFLQTNAIGLHEEQTDELLVELAESKQLRQVGPGVFAKIGKAESPLQHPVFQEERGH